MILDMTAPGSGEHVVGDPASPTPITWQMWHENQEIWPAIFEAIEDAKKSVVIEQYIFSSHGIGHRLLDLLAKKASEGVHVRVLVDGYGSVGITLGAGGKALLRAGGEIATYNGIRAAITNPITHIRRIHRKTVIIDERILMVGGTCFRDDMAEWRDTFLKLDGAVVEPALVSFQFAWDGSTFQRTDYWPKPRKPAPPPPESEWAYLPCGPKPLIGRIYREALLRAIGTATTTVDLTTPYLYPSPRLRRTLVNAVKRGVRVRILIPEKNNHPLFNRWALPAAKKLAAEGVEISLYPDRMMHCKLALTDGAWASIGSLNLDTLSFSLNLENGVSSCNPELCAALNEQLQRDFSISRPL